MPDQLSLLTPPSFRVSDGPTSREAAVAVAGGSKAMHKKILEAFANCPTLTDQELEELSVFRGYGPSTVRKRRSELFQMGKLKQMAVTKNSRGRMMIVWGLS